MVVVRERADGVVSLAGAREAVGEFFARHDYTGKRVVVIVPDNTRSGPVGEIFGMIHAAIGAKAAALDVLVALGTHQPMSEEQICQRLGMSAAQRQGQYSKVRFFNHEWQEPETFKNIGRISEEEIGRISGGLFYEAVDIAINKLIFDYDEFFIVGPVFPHEVVGFSGGHKYIFPGIAAREIIDFFHWLGAVVTNPVINGTKETATRQVVETAASFIGMPSKLFGMVGTGGRLQGLYVGEVYEAWERAAELSRRVQIVYEERTYETVLGVAPAIYDEIWLAGKVMYKLEPVVADGGTLIIYAPHVKEISFTHGELIDAVGYHTRDYFHKRPAEFAHVPGGIRAHSTHVRGIGTFVGGVERPRVNVVLATGISRQRCEQVNLGYMDPASIDPASYAGRREEGVLLVEHAGELLHRRADGKVPVILGETTGWARPEESQKS